MNRAEMHKLRSVIVRTGLVLAALLLLQARDTAAAPADKELHFLCDRVFDALSRLQGDVDYMRIGVARVGGMPRDTRAEDARRVITDHLDHICLRDRHKLAVFPLGEQMEEVVADGQPETIRTRARERHLDAIVIGRADRIGEQYRVVVDVVPTRTGEVASMSEEIMTARSLERFAYDAINGRTRWGATWRSGLLPGWGQFYNDESLKGVLLAACEVTLVATAIAFDVERRRHQSRYGQDTPLAVSSYDKARTATERRDLLLGAAAGVWAFGMLDAWLSGEDYTPEARLTRPSLGVTNSEVILRWTW